MCDSDVGEHGRPESCGAVDPPVADADDPEGQRHASQPEGLRTQHRRLRSERTMNGIATKVASGGQTHSGHGLLPPKKHLGLRVGSVPEVPGEGAVLTAMTNIVAVATAGRMPTATRVEARRRVAPTSEPIVRRVQLDRRLRAH